ncbi:MAG: aminoacyl-tRNA hydrolase [Patescibacteria group bacterium]
MKIVIGLGNPGKKYERTRHNAGFLALDYLMEARKIKNLEWEKKYDSEILKIPFENQEVLFVKPQTFMNESGKAIGQLLKYSNARITDLLIIHDDVDLKLGDIRLYGEGSAGHKGMESIIKTLGYGFTRLRIGVENRTERRIPPTEDYVLKEFPENELAQLKKVVFPRVSEEIKKFIEK